jgi:hypothetical protein
LEAGNLQFQVMRCRSKYDKALTVEGSMVRLPLRISSPATATLAPLVEPAASRSPQQAGAQLLRQCNPEFGIVEPLSGR